MGKIDEIYMKEALKEAKKALDIDEVPVGAIVVHKGKVIARAHNQIKLLKDPTAHAEIIAITQAASFLKNERLIDTILYVTIEPCIMCMGALILARVKKLVYGTRDPKAGACGSVIDVARDIKLNHKIKVVNGILQEDCGNILREFFQKKRG